MTDAYYPFNNMGPFTGIKLRFHIHARRNADKKMEKRLSTRWCFHMPGCECKSGKWIDRCESECECDGLNQELRCSFTNFEQDRHPSFAYSVNGILALGGDAIVI